MPASDLKYVPGRVPEGYVAVPLSADQRGAPIQLCVLVKKEADPVAGHLVTLRDVIDARVLLGCVTDAAGQVHDWVEVWVQDLDGLGTTVAAHREDLCNAMIDERWERQVLGFDRFDRPVIYKTGWERERPPPTWIDVAAAEPVHPVDKETGDRWRLCREDAVLVRAGLPAYSTSLHRYLYLPQLEAESTFVPVTREAPTGKNTKALGEIVSGKGMAALNPGGGLMMVRRYGPIGFQAYLDVLTSGTWPGVAHGRSSIQLDLTDKAESGPSAGTRAAAGAGGAEAGWGGADAAGPGSSLFIGQQGRWGRVVETYHLKVRALADAVAAVRGMAFEAKRPLLNVSADGFQVRLGEPARGLPHLWTARVTLADPGDAIALPIKSSDAKYYLPGRGAAASIYRPESAGRPASGRCTMRIREVLTAAGEDVVLEGTLVTDDRIVVARNDLVWLRVPLAGGRVDLYARVEAQSAMAAGEWRFRTLQQRLAPEAAGPLRAAQGVPVPGTAFEVVPLLSTPCDLYALGVLAVRVLLAGPEAPLPVVLDEVLSLARQLATEHHPAVKLEDRVRGLFEKDPRWAQSLGPQRLTAEKMTPKEALDLVPAGLWYETLAAIVRMFPGIGPDSECVDLGDARAGGVHLVFDQAMMDCDNLLRKTRSLIVIDWKYNREIHAVIRRYLTGIDGPRPGPAPVAPARSAGGR